VTLTHVVMRDFKRKQTWITHANFEHYNIHNWTRRPARLIRVQFVVGPRDTDPKRSAQLADFARRWMEQSELVDQSSYKKSVLVAVVAGIKLECIFYPLPGVDSYPIRQQFIVDLVAAAQRLELPAVPESLLAPYPREEASTGGTHMAFSGEIINEINIDDLLP